MLMEKFKGNLPLQGECNKATYVLLLGIFGEVINVTKNLRS
jgi:hypothetical protein